MKTNTLRRLLICILGMIVTAGLLLALVPVVKPLVKYVVNWQAVMVEHTEVDRMVRSWGERPPMGVDGRDWRHACEALGTALHNAFMPFQVSLENARGFRAEVQQRHKEPVTVETLEWFLVRLGETSPEAADYISRFELWWQDRLDTVRIQSGGPTLEVILEEVHNWNLRRPPKEDARAWAAIITSLRTAILRIYSRTDHATTEALSSLGWKVESLCAQPVTRDTLQRLTQHISEAIPHGAEYMERVEYFRDGFDRLDRMSEKEKEDNGTDGREATIEPQAVVP
jgi:hypothetical protein